MKTKSAFLSGIILALAATTYVQADIPYIEFTGTMFGKDQGPRMGNLGADAYTIFFDSTFSASSSNMDFFAGEDFGSLTLHVGDSALGQSPSQLTGFEVVDPGALGYHDMRIYTGGDFALQWQNNPLVDGDAFVDADVRDTGTTGGAITSVGNTHVSNGMNGADLVNEFNAYLGNNSSQWIARFQSFDPIVQDEIGEFNVTLRLEPLLASRLARGSTVPGGGGLVDFSDHGVRLHFTEATPSEWGGNEVAIEQHLSDPGGTPPDDVVFVSDGQFWEISETLAGFEADIELAYDPEQFSSPEDLVVIMREGEGDSWQVVPSELVEGENRIRVLGQTSFSQWDIAVIPEPSTYALFLAIGTLGCAAISRRRTGKKSS